jgi:hypothetical protein
MTKILATAKSNAFITHPRAVFWEGVILKNNEAKQGNGWGHYRAHAASFLTRFKRSPIHMPCHARERGHPVITGSADWWMARDHQACAWAGEARPERRAMTMRGECYSAA